MKCYMAMKTPELKLYKHINESHKYSVEQRRHNQYKQYDFIIKIKFQIVKTAIL